MYRQMNSQVYDQLKNFINESWGIVGKDGSYPPFFPGPQPISIERKHFPLLKKDDYFVCEKTDGTRIALVCLVVNSKKYTVTVDRAMRMTPVNFNMPRSAYDGTILDGEMVTTRNGKTHFMIYDGVVVGGATIKAMTLKNRIAKIDYFIKGIMRTDKDPFVIKMKTFYGLAGIKHLIMKLKHDDFPYANDGIVLTPIADPVRMGTHETLFKWKPREKNTVDFLVKLRADHTIGLYIQERGQLVFSSQYTPTPAWAAAMKDNMIVECAYNLTEWPRRWEPLNVRTDKTHPNNRRTLSRTMVNIEEDIQLSEFLKIQK